MALVDVSFAGTTAVRYRLSQRLRSATPTHKVSRPGPLPVLPPSEPQTRTTLAVSLSGIP